MGEPLGDEIFQNQPQSDDQPSLGVLFLKVNTLVGLFVGPSCALFVDLAQHPSDGLREVGILISISFAIVAPFCSIPSWPVQMIVLIFICTSQTLCFLYVVRYSVVFVSRAFCCLSSFIVVYNNLYSFLNLIGLSESGGNSRGSPGGATWHSFSTSSTCIVCWNCILWIWICFTFEHNCCSEWLHMD